MSDADTDTAVDAVALFHPVRREALLPFLDLDDESEDSEGIYAEELEDGSFLLHTFQPFALFAGNPLLAQAWLVQLGDVLAEAHDDPRGVLFFPDTIEPEAQTYAAVVAEVGEEGIFIDAAAPDVDALAGAAGIDMAMVQRLAEQLLGGSPDGASPPTPFEIGKLMEGLQGQLMASMQQHGAGQDEHEDEPGDGDVQPDEEGAGEKKK